MSCDDPWSVFEARFRGPLCHYLRRKFPRLADQAEDILHTVVAEALAQSRTRPWTAEELARWLRVAASHRALDGLRSIERSVLLQLSGLESDQAPWEPADKRASPSAELAEHQRRARQGLMLSDVLVAFCRWCESRPEGLKMKEAYERSLRGQRPADIAAATGMSRASVDTSLSRARQWVLQRVRQADVDQSVFLTLHRRLPLPALPSRSESLPPSRAPGVPAALPRLHSFADVVRWVIEELGAMCPSPERLAAYVADPAAPEYRDLRYHVEEVGCPLCRADQTHNQ